MEIYFVDLTSVFFNKVTSKQNHTQIKSETHNCMYLSSQKKNFFRNQLQLRTGSNYQIRESLNFNKVNISTYQQVASQTGLFNDQDHKLNAILNLVKEDTEWVHQQLEILKSNVNNELNQSIYNLLQAQIIKLSEQFKKLLQNHTQKMKVQESKRQQLGERDRLIRRGGYGKYNQTEQLQQPQHQEQHQAIMLNDQKIHQEKLSSMKKIEEMLAEVATVFQRLGTMVRLQETMIDRIDKYTDDSLVNVQKGRKELQEVHKKLSQNRGLILKVFFILFILSFIYIMFIV